LPERRSSPEAIAAGDDRDGAAFRRKRPYRDWAVRVATLCDGSVID